MRTYYYGPRERSKIHPIPIYGVNFEVVVCHDFNRARANKKRLERLGPCEVDCNDANGLASYNRREFCICLKYGEVRHDVIAHEVFHTTVHIFDWINQKIKADNHEDATHLHMYLTQLVYDDLKTWKIKVR